MPLVHAMAYCKDYIYSPFMAEIRDAPGTKDNNSVWIRMRKDPRFKVIDAGTVRFVENRKLVNKSSLPSILSRHRIK